MFDKPTLIIDKLLTRILICANINNVIEICGCGGTGRRAGLRNQCQRRGGSSPFNRTNDVSFELIEQLDTKSIRK